MALLFMDGWDHYDPSDTAIQKWVFGGGAGGGAFSRITGRVGGGALRMVRGSGGGNTVLFGSRTLTQTPGTIICGFAFRTTTLSTDLFNLSDATAGTVQINLQIVGTGQIAVFRGPGSAQLGSNSAVNTLLANTWHYVEVKAIIATGTGGSVGVWVDNIQVLNITGVNTQASANAYVNRVTVGDLVNVNQATVDYDDLYVLDTSAGVGSGGTPLGDSRISTLMPSGNSGDTAGHDQWTQVGGTGGNYWTSVNEIPEDGDTSYVTSGTVGAIENFTHPALPATATTVIAVQFNLLARKDDVGTRQIAPTQRNGATDSVGATGPNLSTTYVDQLTIAENSLQTAIPWTVSEVNASEFGCKVIS